MESQGNSGNAEAVAVVVCPWYTVDDLCVLFGVGDRTIWKWCKQGKLPQPVRRSRKWVRWWRADVDALLAAWARKGGAA